MLTTVAGEDYIINTPSMDFNLTPITLEIELEFNITILDDVATERRETVFFGIELELTENVISSDPVEVVIFDNDPGKYTFVCTHKMFVFKNLYSLR